MRQKFSLSDGDYLVSSGEECPRLTLEELRDKGLMATVALEPNQLFPVPSKSDSKLFKVSLKPIGLIGHYKVSDTNNDPPLLFDGETTKATEVHSKEELLVIQLYKICGSSNVDFRFSNNPIMDPKVAGLLRLMEYKLDVYFINFLKSAVLNRGESFQVTDIAITITASPKNLISIVHESTMALKNDKKKTAELILIVHISVDDLQDIEHRAALPHMVFTLNAKRDNDPWFKRLDGIVQILQGACTIGNNGRTVSCI